MSTEQSKSVALTATATKMLTIPKLAKPRIFFPMNNAFHDDVAIVVITFELTKK